MRIHPHLLLLITFVFGSTTRLIDAYYLEDFDSDPDERAVNEDFDDVAPERKILAKLERDWPSDDVFSQLGEITSSVPLNANGQRTLVLHRADRRWELNTFHANNTLRDRNNGPISSGVLAVVESGELVSSHLKKRFYMPHGLSVDARGNIWVTDVGLHQVFKFSPDLKEEPLLVLGEAFHPGTDDKHFCKPTHVVAAANGDFFVSDGYCNSRIMKFDSTGKFLTKWGKETSDPKEPGPYELNLPHELTLIEDEDLICVADRENYRVVCYVAGLTESTRNGTGQFVTEFRTEWVRPGPVYGVAFCAHTQALFLLVRSIGMDYPEEVQIYDFRTRQYSGRLIDEIEDFGDAHTISACDSRNGSGCLLVSSLSPPAVNLFGQQRRRLWMYRLLLDEAA